MAPTQHHIMAQRLLQVATDCADALGSVRVGCRLALNDRLRESLYRVAQAMQEALEDGAQLEVDSLAMLCAIEAKAQCRGVRPGATQARHDYTRTLFEYSRSLLTKTARQGKEISC